jgi:hypothetical protein
VDSILDSLQVLPNRIPILKKEKEKERKKEAQKNYSI